MGYPTYTDLDVRPFQNGDTVKVQGIWLQKSTAHLGNEITVLAQLEDGTWRKIVEDVADDGPISHIVEPAGIRQSPEVKFES